MNIYADQLEFFDPHTWIEPVHLIGAGGINNLVGPSLAKMGIKEIHIWDDDILEARNCPNEIAYSYKMVGRPKVAAMAGIIYYLDDHNPEVIQHQARVKSDTKLSGVVISGVDSMTSRKIIWSAVESNLVDIPLYIDGRSAGKYLAVFAFSPADYDAREKYKTWLFDDDQALSLPCGARNFPPASLRIASEITRIIADFHSGNPVQFYTKCEL